MKLNVHVYTKQFASFQNYVLGTGEICGPIYKTKNQQLKFRLGATTGYLDIFFYNDTRA